MSKVILCLETATKICSVALFKEGKMIGVKEESSEEYIHSEKLALFIDEVLTMTETQPSDLSAVAVSSGPGSYTGLRIGVSTAKGICLGANSSLISIPNLTQMAAYAIKMHSEYDFYIPMLDARRMEVFTSVFDTDFRIVRETEALVVDENSFGELKGKKIAIFGDGASKCMEVLNHLDVELLNIHCSARNMGELALEKLRTNSLEDLAYFEPYYLKEFVAGKPKKLI